MLERVLETSNRSPTRPNTLGYGDDGSIRYRPLALRQGTRHCRLADVREVLDAGAVPSKYPKKIWGMAAFHSFFASPSSWLADPPACLQSFLMPHPFIFHSLFFCCCFFFPSSGILILQLLSLFLVLSAAVVLLGPHIFLYLGVLP